VGICRADRLLILAIASALVPWLSAQGAVTFTDVAARAGIQVTNLNDPTPQKLLPETMGSGAALFDYDNDGWLDIFLVDGGSIANPQVAGLARHRLYRNRRNGTFEDVSARSGIRHRGYGMGVCAGDYDRDGHVDLYVTNVGPNVMYRNRGDGTFADVPLPRPSGSPLRPSGSGGQAGRQAGGQTVGQARPASVDAGEWSTSCAFADLDRDGDLDLFVTRYLDAAIDRNPFCGDARTARRSYCHPLAFKPLRNVLYRNEGNGTFTDVSEQSGITRHGGNGLGVVIADLDDDLLPDIFVANDALPNSLFFNEGGWRFAEGGLLAGVAVAADGKARAGMGTDAGDYDGDGLIDLIVTNHETETTSLYRNLGTRLFGYVTDESGIAMPTRPYVGFGVVFVDYDNDRALDVAIVNGHVLDNTAILYPGSTHAQRKLLLRNLGTRRFGDAGKGSGAGFAQDRVGRGLAAGDIDNDGDQDLLVTNNGGPVELLRNDGGNAQNSLLVQLAGRTSNRDGIGARLRITAGKQTRTATVKAGSSYLTHSDVRAHFGLGRLDRVERLEVRWPDGRIEAVQDVAANQIVTIREGEGIVKGVPFVR
jgi:enediyne biosynthesis protein E4